jgi:hypothetical protein
LGIQPPPPIEKTVIAKMALMESEHIKNLWGVSLKKRELNKTGEEVIFLDTHARKPWWNCHEPISLRKKKVLTAKRDDDGKEIIQENVTNPSERDDIVQAIAGRLKRRKQDADQFIQPNFSWKTALRALEHAPGINHDDVMSHQEDAVRGSFGQRHRDALQYRHYTHIG